MKKWKEWEKEMNEAYSNRKEALSDPEVFLSKEQIDWCNKHIMEKWWIEKNGELKTGKKLTLIGKEDSDIEEIPVEFGSLKRYTVSITGFNKLKDLGKIPKCDSLIITNCSSVESLDSIEHIIDGISVLEIHKCKSLKHTNIKGNFTKITINDCENYTELDLDEVKSTIQLYLSNLPIKNLDRFPLKISNFDITECNHIVSYKGAINVDRFINISNCSNIRKIKELDVECRLDVATDDIEILNYLPVTENMTIQISESQYSGDFIMSSGIKNSKYVYVSINNSKLKNFTLNDPNLNISNLNFFQCKNLESVSITDVKDMTTLHIGSCDSFKSVHIEEKIHLELMRIFHSSSFKVDNIELVTHMNKIEIDNSGVENAKLPALCNLWNNFKNKESEKDKFLHRYKHYLTAGSFNI